MISRVLTALERGLLVMRLNSHMLLVGALVFVFPLLFVWVTNSLFEFTSSSIDTADRHRIGVLHDSITALVLSNAPTEIIQSTIESVAKRVEPEDQIKVSDIKLFKEVNGELVVLNAFDRETIGTTTDSGVKILRKTPFSDVFDFHSSDYDIGKSIIRQSYQRIATPDGYFYLMSEHDRTSFESLLMSRKQTSYLILSVIFSFLIALAYWLNKQVDWKKNHSELEEQLNERDLFSNMIAHEFRSPLTAIKGYSSFLQESNSLSKDELRFAANIYNSAERLVVLVNDFLEVSRLHSGKIKVEISEVDLRDILTSVSEDLKGLAEGKNLRLVYQKSANQILFKTDPARMTQVLINIVSNAVKYTDSGTVELECSQMPGEVTITVKDTGTGISAEDQQKLFAPFTRVGDVDEGSTTGTGLGMWITKQLVALLNGTIGVESIKGVGTHIVIRFKQ
ncbi:MAG: signal transduction histidine kinase [Candidatus Paceibacteria bacterium]|jgi:signal transduction histidine kinase